MNERIVYQNDTGRIAVIIPSREAVERYGIQAVALKDVPAGKPFKIINADDLPSDRTFRDAWEVDPSILTDGVGSESDVFEEIV